MVMQPIILVIEDDPEDIERARIALKAAQVIGDIIQLTDGQQATEYIDSVTSEPPALILLDLNLPLVPGIYLLKKIRESERLKKKPVIITTGARHQNTIIESLEIGADDYLEKPIDPERLKAALVKLGLHWLFEATNE